MSVDDFATIISSVVGVGGLWLAYSVRNLWKTEKIWTRDADFGQLMHEKCFEAETNFERLRSPLPRSIGQQKDVPDNRTLSKHSRIIGAQGIFDLYDGQSGFWSEFFSLEFRARGLVGKQVVEPFQELQKCRV